MPTPGIVPDDLWAEIEKLIPPPPPPRYRGGRKRASESQLLDAMLYILWTGAPWRAMPKEFSPWQTVYDRFAEWERAGFFEDIWRLCLHLYDQQYGIDWEWQAGDGTYVRSPMGGKRMRPQSDGSREMGHKRSVFERRAGSAAFGSGDSGQCQRRPNAARVVEESSSSEAQTQH